MGRLIHFEIHVDDMDRAKTVLWRSIWLDI